MNDPKLKYLTASMLIAMGMSTTPVIAEPTVEVAGAVEVEINSGKDHTAAKGSDIALATVELAFDAKINDKVSAHILMLHEDDSTESPTIDEGIITISNGKDASKYLAQEHHRPGSPTRQSAASKGMFVYLNAGRMYVPFGNFESNMISDPLTLEIAETQEAAVQVGFETHGFQASVYAFNGEADQTGVDKDVIDDFGISLSFAMKFGSFELDLGADYINNMAETDTFQEVIIAGPVVVQEHTAGIAAHAIINVGAFTLIAEHVTASDDFNTIDLQFNGAKASPSASNIEIAYTMGIGGQDVTVAVAQQSTADIDVAGIGLPESRSMLSVSTTVANDVGLKIEFSNASDYETADGGSGESGGMLTAQLAVEF
ncbi:MAG: LbtU family siderophore porin [Gammaproteobacteria bacterium]